MTPSQRRKQELSAKVIADYDAGIPIADILARNGIARQTLYNVLRRSDRKLGRTEMNKTQDLLAQVRELKAIAEKRLENLGWSGVLGPFDEDREKFLDDCVFYRLIIALCEKIEERLK